MTKADIVICGAGLAGISAAYHLTVKKGISDVRHYQAKGTRPLGSQPAGYATGAVAQTLDDVQYTLPRGWTHLALVVDHPRNRHERDAGFLSHVRHRNTTGHSPPFPGCVSAHVSAHVSGNIVYHRS